MRAVKSRNNSTTELRLISLFKKSHIVGWRRNYKVYGKPDFIFQKKKIAVFVDGCFWHGHSCRNTTPNTNKDYWERKLLRNKKRDTQVNEHLSKLGWRVLRFWECELKKSPERIIKKITDALYSCER